MEGDGMWDVVGGGEGGVFESCRYQDGYKCLMGKGYMLREKEGTG